MIRLITGLPGAGKTLYAIECCEKYVAEGRHVFVLSSREPAIGDGDEEANADGWYSGIRDLDYEGTGFQRFDKPVAEWATIGKGNVLLIDEAQRFLPAIVRRGEVPTWIEQLTRNRHYGLDIVLVTQHPKLLDSFVRRLTNRHDHLINVFGRGEANLYTWTQVCEEPENKSQRQAADKVRWKYPIAIYKKYKSADLHTRKAHTPRMVRMGKWALVACFLAVVLAVGLLWRMKSSVQRPSRSDEAAHGIPAKSGPSLLGGLGGGLSSKGLTREQWIAERIPRIDGEPWSAPIFDGKAVSKPDIYCVRIVAVGAPERCSCYSEQMTVLHVKGSTCLDIVKNGVYNPYRAPLSSHSESAIAASAQPSGERSHEVVTGLRLPLPSGPVARSMAR